MDLTALAGAAASLTNGTTIEKYGTARKAVGSNIFKAPLIQREKKATLKVLLENIYPLSLWSASNVSTIYLTAKERQ